MKKLLLSLFALASIAPIQAMEKSQNYPRSTPIAISKKSNLASGSLDCYNLVEQLDSLDIDEENEAAIGERKLVPYNEAVHGNQARNIFYTAFNIYDECLESESYRANKHDMIERKVFVLLRQEKVIGVLTYYDTKETQGITKRYISRFAIHEAYRNNPEKHGSFALHAFEAETLKDGITIIELVSYKRTAKFYRKCGYTQISQLYEMQKNLTSEKL